MEWKRLVKENYDQSDTVELIIDSINEYHGQDMVKDLLSQLPSPENIDNFSSSLFDLVNSKVKYLEDDQGDETVSTPTQPLRDGIGDCKKMTVVIASVFKEVGYEVLLKLVSLEGRKWDHIYPIVPILNSDDFIVMDVANWGQYDTEGYYTDEQIFKLDKSEYMPRKLSMIGAQPYNKRGLGRAIFELERDMSGRPMGISAGEGKAIAKALKAVWKGIKWLWKHGGKDQAEKFAENQLKRAMSGDESLAMRMQTVPWGPVRIEYFQPNSAGRTRVVIEGKPDIKKDQMLFITDSPDGIYDGPQIIRRIWKPLLKNQTNFILEADYIDMGEVGPNGKPLTLGAGAYLDDDEGIKFPYDEERPLVQFAPIPTSRSEVVDDEFIPDVDEPVEKKKMNMLPWALALFALLRS